uniref:Gigaxonin n=2 Tax=Eptatretus burgeri TaxID=7764 RepID=A0A8C4PZY5_EPTBU
MAEKSLVPGSRQDSQWKSKGDAKGATASESDVVTIKDPQHANKLLDNMRSFREDPQYCDSVLVVDGQEIPIQRSLLVAMSPYLRTKFTYSPPKQDGMVYRIPLEGIDACVMREILDYIYTGEVRLSEENIQDVLQAADLLLLIDLKNLCCEFLEGCIVAENCVGIRDFALHYSLLHVHRVATEFLETHFRDVCATEEFLELPPKQLREVLTLEKLNVGNERYVLEGVLLWLQHDLEGRKVHLKEVMGGVWLDALDTKYLQEQMVRDSLVRDVITECRIPLTETRSGVAVLNSFRPRGYSECIVTAGGEDRNTRIPIATMRCMCPLYDPNRQLWVELTPMSTSRVNHGAVSAEGYLFAIGGQDAEKKVLNSGEKYNPDTNTWSPIAPMKQARMNFGLVHIDGMLYAIGGEDEDSELLTGETYDIYLDTWNLMPNLSILRKIGCYAVMKKKIYAMGGGSYGKLFESVECYDPKTQQWTSICPLKECRFGAVACGLGQDLYVFGGVRRKESEPAADSPMVTCKSEIYQDSNKRWMYLRDQALCVQSGASFVYGAVPIGASIYVIGDLDTGTQYDFIREYRRSSCTWHHTKPLLPSDPRRSGCASLRIANCRLFRLQMEQGLFHFRINH